MARKITGWSCVFTRRHVYSTPRAGPPLRRGPREADLRILLLRPERFDRLRPGVYQRVRFGSDAPAKREEIVEEGSLQGAGRGPKSCGTVAHFGQIECDRVLGASIAASAARGGMSHSSSNSTRPHHAQVVIISPAS